jgi:hypothetical protein
MTDYSFYIGLIKQKLEDNATISAAVQGHIYTSSPGMLPADDELYGKTEDPNLQKACIGIQHGGLSSQALPGIYWHGFSNNDHLIFIHITVENLSDSSNSRNSDTYAAYLADLIHDLLKGGISITMDGSTHQILFNTPFKITTMSDPAFLNRANCKIQTSIRYYS